MATHDHTQSYNGSNNLVDDTKRLTEDVRQMYHHLKEDNSFGRLYQDNPYAVIAAAAGVGYVLGGGLLSPFTRRLLRVGMKALIVPVAASQLKTFAQSGGGSLNGQTPSSEP
ncbi:MAG: hypothetical protein ACNA8W_03290 [Bradymonadaceae bacterium]